MRSDKDNIIFVNFPDNSTTPKNKEYNFEPGFFKRSVTLLTNPPRRLYHAFFDRLEEKRHYSNRQ